MLVRHWILAGGAGLFVAGVSAAGCGSTTTDTFAPTDAGQDGTFADAPVDTGHDTAPADTGVDACTSDADLNNLNVPDAALADGASSVGLCVGCVHAQCTTELNGCNGDCECRGAIVDLFTCVGKGTSLVTCAGPLIAGGGLSQTAQQYGQALAVCVYASCKGQCAPTFDASAFIDAAGDAHNDAPGEGG